MLQANDLPTFDRGCVTLALEVAEWQESEFTLGAAAVDFVTGSVHIWRHSEVDILIDNVLEVMRIVIDGLSIVVPDRLSL